jgi:hypothetical protein
MSNDAAGFVGSIPHYYDQGLGPIIFAEYAADIARRTAAGKPARVLETAPAPASSPESCGRRCPLAHI